MSVTELTGKLFSLGTSAAGAYIGASSYGLKGAVTGIVAGYLTGSILFTLIVYIQIALSDSKKKRGK